MFGLIDAMPVEPFLYFASLSVETRQILIFGLQPESKIPRFDQTVLASCGVRAYGIGNATQVLFGSYDSEQKDRIQPDRN